ncbi:hypothetical protein WJX74_009057 [Apatococcus lobatus]|uniref:Dystroglycan-type cadherin-like domain-containing protein n=1 Tax=Apatococcus lobatus TaxID=904363 RepID=A0AAW1RT83_9CHLO
MVVLLKHVASADRESEVEHTTNVLPFEGLEAQLASQALTSLQGVNGDFLAVDLGHDKCQPWPLIVQLTAPYAYGGPNMWPNHGGPPTDFSVDASSAGLQPLPDDSAWSNLLDVKSFEPPLEQGTHGIFSHKFQILPQDGLPRSPGASLQDLNISLSDAVGTNLSINVEDAFPAQNRSCCSTFTAEMETNGTIGALPSWLALTYGFVPDAMSNFNLSSTDSYSYIPPFLDVGLNLTLASYPGVQAVGSYLLNITAASADQPPVQTSKILTLQVLGAGPTVNSPLQAVEVADGSDLSYTIPDDTFQLNKPYGDLTLSANLPSGDSLPSWLNVDATGGELRLSGTPSSGSDQSYQLNITATDSDGAKNSTLLDLEVRAACPTGLYRHFRVIMQPTNNPDHWMRNPNSYSQATSLICSLIWSSPASGNDSDLVMFPSSEVPAGNISGTSYQGLSGGDATATPDLAFSDDLGSCQSRQAWETNDLGWVSIDLGQENCQPWPESMDVAAPITQSDWPGGGMPTAFRADASGAALQPLPDSSDWQLLVDVEGFEPSYPSSNCGECGGTCLTGVLRHTFPILPFDASAPSGAPAPGPAAFASSPSASRPKNTVAFNSSLTVSLADGLGTLYPLDIDDMFISQSRTYPPSITTAFINASGQASPLPEWLAFSWNLTLVESVMAGEYDYEYVRQRIYDGVYALSLASYPGVAAIAQDSIEVTATDQSAAQPAPQLVDLVLNVAAAGPTVVNDIPLVEIEDGQPLSFTIPDDTFQANIAEPDLVYQASLSNTDPRQAALPGWLTFESVGTLSGTPMLGQDGHYSLTITAIDTQGGSNSTTLDLHVRAPCPAGLYRHFRMRLLPANDDGFYQLAPDYYFNSRTKRSAVCAVNIANAIKPADDGYAYTSLNTSGTSYEGSGPCSSDGPAEPKAAFQDVEYYGCGTHWKGNAGDWVAVDLGFPGCQSIPQNFTLAAPYNLYWYYALGPPTDFAISAASSGVQPTEDDSSWDPVLTVSDFKPIPTLPYECSDSNNNCPNGLFQHTFSIPTYNASLTQPAPPSILKPLSAVRAETGMPQDLLISLDGVFQLNSNSCCASISVSLANYTSDAPSTPLAPMQAPAPAAPLSDTGVLVLAPVPATAIAAGPQPFSQDPSIIFEGLPSWLSYAFNMSIGTPLTGSYTNDENEVLTYIKAQSYDALQTLVVSDEVEVADLGQYLIRVAGTDPSNGLTTLTYFTLSIQDYYQLRAQVQLVGISAAQFDETAQQAFRQGIANVLGVALDQVVIVGVTDVPVSGRRLQQSSGTALKVDFSVQGIKSQAAAGALATSIADVVSSGALDTTLQTLGLPVAATLTVAPTVTQTPTVAAVSSPPPPAPVNAPPSSLPPGVPPAPRQSPPIPKLSLPPHVAPAPGPVLAVAPRAAAMSPPSSPPPKASNLRLNATFGLASFTMETFNQTAQNNFRGAIADAARDTYRTTVTTDITDIRAGSVVVDASLLFLASSSAVINSFTSDLQNNPGSIFPSSTFGDVRAVSFNGQMVTPQSVPSPPPATPTPASWWTTGRIIGVAVGSAVAAVFIVSAVALLVRWRASAARKQKVAAGYGSERSALM